MVAPYGWPQCHLAMFHGRDDLGPPPAPTRHTHRHYADLQPWKLSFLGLLRGLSARHATLPRVGRAPRPQAEPFRIGQVASLTFAPREIAKLEQRADRLRIQLFGLGMLGPNGALPIHLTEIVRERTEAHHDNTCLLYTSPSPRDRQKSRMPSSA